MRRSISHPPVRARRPFQRPSAKSRVSFWRMIRRGYRRSVSLLDTFEKSPIVRLTIAFVFLITATAVLIDLNDRNTQLEIAAWDLFEKTETGSPQRKREVQLLANVGADLGSMDIGAPNKETEAVNLYNGTEDIASVTRFGVAGKACSDFYGEFRLLDLAPKRIWQVTPPFVIHKPAKFSQARFNCLDMSEIKFNSAFLASAEFVGATIADTDLSSTILVGSKFDGSFLIEAVKFTNAKLRFASFEHADLYGVDFARSDLRQASFMGASISQSDFSDADMTDVNVSGVMFDHNLTGILPHIDKLWAWEGFEPYGAEWVEDIFLCSNRMRKTPTVSTRVLGNDTVFFPKNVPEECSYAVRMKAHFRRLISPT